MRKAGLILLCVFLLINGCAILPGQTTAAEDQLQQQQQLQQELKRQQERRAVIYWSQQVQPIIVADAKMIEWWDDFRERYPDNVATGDEQEQLEVELDLFIDRYKTLHDAVIALDYPQPSRAARETLLNYLARQEPMAESLKLSHRTDDVTRLTEAMVKMAEVNLLREQFIEEYTKLVEEWS